MNFSFQANSKMKIFKNEMNSIPNIFKAKKINQYYCLQNNEKFSFNNIKLLFLCTFFYYFIFICFGILLINFFIIKFSQKKLWKNNVNKNYASQLFPLMLFTFNKFSIRLNNCSGRNNNFSSNLLAIHNSTVKLFLDDILSAYE